VSVLRILIVDDIPVNLRLLRAQLEAEGFTVFSAGNGLEALEVMKRENVDVIVSDILMPEMDGYRLCSEVRRNEQFKETPFIFHTATYTSPSDEKLSFSLGADRFLRKPASMDDLLHAIRETVAGSRRAPLASLEGMDVLKAYNERLVSKLEEKNIELFAAVNKINLQTTALETAADAMLITNVKGTIHWINQAFVDMTGYSREEAIGRTPRILRSGKHDAAFYRDFWETILAGRVWRGEFTNRRKDGTLSYDEHTVSPVHGEDGEITHFVGILHDITRRKQAEQELRDTHARLRHLLEHSPAVIYALAVEGDEIIPRLASENVTRLLGFSVEETLSYEWWLGRLHPEDRKLATESIAVTLRDGVSQSEYRLRHKDGSWRWVDDNRRLIRDDRGTPIELVGVWTDVTERHVAQDELRISEQRFSDMLRNLHLVALTLDLQGRITYCNDYLLNLTGWTREELLSRDFFEVFTSADDAGNLRKAFRSLLHDDPKSRHYESEMLTRSGERRLVRWNNSALRSGSNDVIGTVSIGEDITEQKNLERQLFHAQRLESLGTLASGIAHDLNNLFMPILIGATLMKRLETSERSQKAIRTIENCVRRGTDLVKQVLLFARGVEGRRVRVDIADVISEVGGIVLSTFPKNMTLTTSIAATLPSLMADRTQLVQVFLNLSVNARDAMPDGGCIKVSAECSEVSGREAVVHGIPGGRYVVLEVADEGTGMPQKVMDRVFEPFYTTKRVGQGTGLGLSTSLGIVRSHGGFMTVSSSEGNGSSFKVYLPVPPADSNADPPGDDALDAVPAGHGELILVVDDEAAILEVVRQTLEEVGYEVLTADGPAEGIEAYKRFASRRPLVLTDMMMPGMDGATFIAALRRIDSHARIIAASGGSDGAMQKRALDAGALRVLMKPVATDLLLRVISEELHSTGC